MDFLTTFITTNDSPIGDMVRLLTVLAGVIFLGPASATLLLTNPSAAWRGIALTLSDR